MRRDTMFMPSPSKRRRDSTSISSKPPLCKGRWIAVGETEGLSAYTTDLQILLNDRFTIPQSAIADSSLCWGEPFYDLSLTARSFFYSVSATRSQPPMEPPIGDLFSLLYSICLHTARMGQLLQGIRLPRRTGLEHACPLFTRLPAFCKAAVSP